MSEEHHQQQQSSLFVKGATLTSFVVLMVGFVAFKAGLFESRRKEPVINVQTPTSEVLPQTYMYANTTSNTIPDNNRVEQRVLDEHNEWVMMASSKTSIAFEPRVRVNGEPLLLRTMASSSKSLTLADPLPWWKWIPLYEPRQHWQSKQPAFEQGKK